MALTFFQRRALRQLQKAAHKRPDEPLSQEDWATYFQFASENGHRRFSRLLTSIPSSPRCGFCGAPFAGLGNRVLAPLGYRPSRKNPNICDVCIELSPPGGMTTEAGVLFADVRGFTALAEGMDPQQTTVLLRRFYGCAERVLFPEALIDKLIGDEVMALYLPGYLRVEGRATVAPLMLDHARALLASVGYGAPDGPFVELGIGIDYGEAFVGNIGHGAVHDFTAIGDVVNTAARLQGQAGGGEIVVAERVVEGLDAPPGEAVTLAVKGKDRPVAARRIAV
ncbi:MAG TPA: adenylate/guanylate cyclase domain-containing protein [Solirubrobacteraceae bacterium]|nr:adenylate/guanylate cyclase domain-containing protein [Solirubrobacteraceae bacterium]